MIPVQNLLDIKVFSIFQFSISSPIFNFIDFHFFLKKKKDSVYCIAINPVDSNIIASGGGDDKAFIWNSVTGEKIHELLGN